MSSLLVCPRDVLATIVSYVPPRHWPSIARTCRSLHRAVWSLRTVRLPNDGLLRHLTRFGLLDAPQLALVGGWTPTTDLTRLKLLRRVLLSGTVGITLLRALHSLQCLKELILLNLEEPSWAVVAALTKLESLDLDSSEIRDADFARFSSLQCLRSLSLAYCRNLTAAAFHTLTQIKSLQHLNVSFTALRGSVRNLSFISI